jgi:hypothetical protein
MRTTNPFEYAELINVLSEGLHMGLFTKEEITQWADYFVLQDDEPDIFFIDLALSNTKDGALTILNGQASAMLAVTTSRPLFGALYRQVISKKKEATSIPEELFGFVYDELLSKQEKSLIYALDLAADYLAVSSGITVQELEEGVSTFLSIYKDYTIGNYACWNTLDEQVNQTLEKLGNASQSRDNLQTKMFHSWKFWQ